MNDSLLKQVIAAAAGCNIEEVSFPYPKSINSPLSILLTTFDAKLESQIDFALVYGGYPECFLLEIAGRFIVIVNSSYLGLVYGLVAAFFGSMPINESELYTATKLGFCVDLVQMFIPAEIFDAEIRERIITNINAYRQKAPQVFMLFQSEIAEIEMLPYDEFYIALWFYFVAHEIGHCVRKTDGSNQIIYGDLNDLIISDETTAQEHVRRIREALGIAQYEFFYKAELELLFEINDRDTLIDEIFCDQTAFVIVLEMISVLKERQFGDFSDLGYLTDSIFKIFVAHQKLLELRRLRQRLGIMGQEGLKHYRTDKIRNAIRFTYLRDIAACLVPCGDPYHFKTSHGFQVFGYYGAMGIREMANHAQSVKSLEFDPLIDASLNVVFEGCFADSI